jgi:hypothetical protein
MPYAPSGTIEFGDGEQVDFRTSSLQSVTELARIAAELAMPQHQIAPNEALDRNRIESTGERVIDVAGEPLRAEGVFEIDSVTLAQLGTLIVTMRLRHNHLRATQED